MLTRLREEYELASVNVFGPPGSNVRWRLRMDDLGIKYSEVPRRLKGSSDPNDLAMAMEAVRLACQSPPGTTVGVAVSDIDFVLLAEYLRHLGREVLLVASEGHSLGLGQAFEAVGAGVVSYPAPSETGGRRPKLRAVLHCSGESTFEELCHQDLGRDHSADHSALAEVLVRLQYLESETDPLLPGLAKLFHASALGPLSVWPPALATAEAAQALQRAGAACQQTWRQNPGNLVFVLPRGPKDSTKATLAKYGSEACAMFVRGGGPFILRDLASDLLVSKVLSRLGYLDGELNADLGEAIQAFCEVGWNSRVMSSLGLRIAPWLSWQAKLALLHSALVLPKSYGMWKVAPSDSAVRLFLAARTLIRGPDAPREEVFHALRRYARCEGLPERVTYNLLVSQVLQHWNKGDPSLRR